jgi:HlyD family secretion protein
MNKKWLIVAAVVVLVAVLGFVGYQRISARRAVAETPAETAVVRRGTLLVTVNATGSLAPHAEVSLAFSSGGRVAEVLVEEGQQVEAGQPLVRLEMDDLVLQVAQAEASLAQIQAGPRAEEIAAAEAALRSAQANCDKVAAGPRAEDVAATVAALSSAQANYDKVATGARPEDVTATEAALRGAQASYDKLAAGPRPEEVTMAQADLEKAAAAVRRAQADYDKVAGNPHVAALPQALALEQATLDYEKAQAAYELKVNGPTPEELAAVQAQVDQAQAQLEKLKNSPTPEELAVAQAQVDQAQAQLEKLKNSPTPEELAAAQAQVDQAQAQLEKLENTPTPEELTIAQVQADQARLRLEQATLTAPMTAAVTALHVQPGEMASAGQPAVVLSDLAALEVEVNLDETDVARVAVGQEAQVSLDAFPGVELAGEVTYIAPMAQTQVGVVLYPVTIRLAPADTENPVPVRAGMTADVTIVVASKEDALLVPLRAIETEGEHAYVQRLTVGQTERVEVTLGMMTDTQVEITGGLSEGDVVIVVAGPAQGSTVELRGLGGIFGGGE